jgi:light-regulated signal transduction histidine kinase (bacteriophytochrome)
MIPQQPHMPPVQNPLVQDPQALISLLESELSTTNHEVMVLTLELEQRVTARTAQLSLINQELMKAIEARRHAEEEVKRLNHDLQLRAALLQEANEELEAFSSSVSHDLRNPIFHIVGFASILEQEAGPALDEKARMHLQQIKTGAMGMSKLIDELLRFSRCAHTELHWEQADMNFIVDQVVADLEPETRGRNIAWKRTQLPAAPCDPALLKQVFINLISNALKYTRRRQETEIEIGSIVHRAGELIYLIRDNGVGFDPKQNDQLFGVFKRLHKSEDFEGTGIGLANVRRIISRHGGRTWAEGTPNAGATFYFSLPEKIAAREAKLTA